MSVSMGMSFLRVLQFLTHTLVPSEIHLISKSSSSVVVSRFGNPEPHVDFLLDILPVSSEVALLSPQKPDASVLLLTGNKNVVIKGTVSVGSDLMENH
ncbi:hepatocyte growth factor receptor-like [Hoplias malabaricus]|uniref:hepatocyte growth factor receptor-like n=1 Tax=Hoplias malabaricus TaxID=27720 RepID=UPI003462AE73